MNVIAQALAADNDLQRSRLAVFGFVVLIAIYRLGVIHFQPVPLFFDEAQYYGWSKDLAFGYYSKPPVIAWLIAATTGLFGQGEAAVKLAAPLLYSGTALLAYGLGRRLFDEQVGLMSALALATIPGVGISALFITTDAPLMFFWALTAYCFLRARDSAGWGWWLAAGVSGGLGLLSKYTLIALPLSFAVYLAASPAHRALLRNKRFWTAAVIAALVFLPNLVWNALHHFPTLAHTAEISQIANHDLVKPGKLLEFLVGQIGVIGPLLSLPLLWLAYRWKRVRGDDGLWFCVALTLPLLALISAQALLSRANVNWAMPAFIGGTIAACAVLRHRRGFLTAALALNVLIGSVVYHYHDLAAVAGVELTRKTDPYFRLLGWPELGRAAKRYVEPYPQVRVAASSRLILANLLYYAQLPPARVDIWNPDGHVDNHYDLTADMARHPGANYVYFTDSPLTDDQRARFEATAEFGQMRVEVYPDLKRTLYVYGLQGFKGYR